MHFGTNEIFQGTFKRTTLEKVLKFAKVPAEIIQRVMMSVVDAPFDPGEVAIVHVISILANPILLETRQPYKILNSNRELIGLGLAHSADEAAAFLHWHTPNITVLKMTPAEYNSLVTSTDLMLIRTFGLGREL